MYFYCFYWGGAIQIIKQVNSTRFNNIDLSFFPIYIHYFYFLGVYLDYYMCSNIYLFCLFVFLVSAVCVHNDRVPTSYQDIFCECDKGLVRHMG